MSTTSIESSAGIVAKPAGTMSRSLKVWAIATIAGLSVAWPMLYAAIVYGPAIIIRSFTGDAYHYLAIARNAQRYHIYTYDGIHVTNGFHPLWEYFIRGIVFALHLQGHEHQAIAVMFAALIATTLGIVLASSGVIRMTNRYFLGLLLVPGLFYLTIGVHVRDLWIWSALDGMESAFSVLFGGLFFYLLSFHVGTTARKRFDSVAACRTLGWILPLTILSRLDDFFILPAFLIALLFYEALPRKRVVAGAWIVGPSTLAILAYLIYNKLTVGAAMPLSGSTKEGFVGFLTTYLVAAVHFPPLLELKYLLSKKPSDGSVIFINSFRYVEMLYPLLLAGFGMIAIWGRRKQRPEFLIWFALCLYIVFKVSYNYFFVHPWHQAPWYYQLIALSLSVMGAVALQRPWAALEKIPVVKIGVVTVYAGLMALCASQYYASLVYVNPESPEIQLWQRHNQIRQELIAHGVTGLVNVDDGITAFLLDLPCVHGFAFATDVQAQKAHDEGRMLSLAYARGINTIAGFGYMTTEDPPTGDSGIREYLRNSLAYQTMYGEIDQFQFSLVYYDPGLKMPFFSFRPRAR
jgi:hypothetical protein